MRHIWRFTLGLALASPLISAHALAQTPSHAAGGATADSANALIGIWEGNYTSDHAPTAPMRLTIARDKEWSAKLEISMGDGQMQSVPVRSFAYAPPEISFIIDMMQQACQATSALKERALHGKVLCGQGSISFTLTKKGP
jgi:hypothetical protein